MLHSVKITGSGSVVPGEYDAIKVSGSGKLYGPITCNELKVSGSCKQENDLHVKEMKVSGTYKGESDCIADTLKITGSFKNEGNIKAKELLIDGIAKVENAYINADYIRVNGSLHNGLEINSDRLVVNGLLNAKDIVGTTIEILKGESFSINKGFFFFGRSVTLNIAQTITCETLYARFLKSEKICAEDITLIESNVEYIECNGVLRIDSLSKVKLIEGDCEIIHV